MNRRPPTPINVFSIRVTSGRAFATIRWPSRVLPLTRDRTRVIELGIPTGKWARPNRSFATRGRRPSCPPEERKPIVFRRRRAGTRISVRGFSAEGLWSLEVGEEQQHWMSCGGVGCRETLLGAGVARIHQSSGGG